MSYRIATGTRVPDSHDPASGGHLEGSVEGFTSGSRSRRWAGPGGGSVTPFRPGLPAAEVDAALKASLAVLQQAESISVLWFGEIVRRRIYRNFGCSSIQQYAEERLGFSHSKLRQFLRLTRALADLPELRAAVAEGEVPWTRARVVASVATKKTESRWVDAARTRSRRDLEVAVKRARREGEEARQGQVLMPLNRPVDVPNRGAVESAPVEVPITRLLRLTPVQAARYEALVEKLRKQHVAGSPEDLVLAGLEGLVEATRTARRAGGERTRGAGENPPPGVIPGVDPARAAASDNGNVDSIPDRASFDPPSRCPVPTHQVVVHLCPQCGEGAVTAGGRPRKLSLAALQAVLCDTRVSVPGQPNRSSVPPRLRRIVLERDGFACRVRGCRNTRFLEVHHVTPRRAGGSHRLENLLTVCSACHRLAHEHVGGERGLVTTQDSGPDYS